MENQKTTDLIDEEIQIARATVKLQKELSRAGLCNCLKSAEERLSEAISAKESLNKYGLTNEQQLLLNRLSSACVKLNIGTPVPDSAPIHLYDYTFAVFTECLEGKHNDFLQSIIDRTK